jgi:uncharacterized repeat protein (TIGR01451 family)
MKLRLAVALMLLLIASTGRSLGQYPPVSAPLPAAAQAPLLYARFLGPPGMRASFYQGGRVGQTFDAPVSVGLRPGYVYRVKLTNLPDLPGVALFPTLEVRGSLFMGSKLAPPAYPAPVVLTEQDVTSALQGSLVTKVIYLEHPERAPAVATTPDRPLERDLPVERDPLEEARAYGRPVLIVRIGQRSLTDWELAHDSIPGTILLPGGRVLSYATKPPYIPWAKVPVYDPVLGPRPPEEECLHDGGDVGTPAGIGAGGVLHGLDPSDTLAEYVDSKGRRCLAKSNRICLCVPRYVVLRTVLPLAGYDTVQGPGATEAVKEQVLVQGRVPPLLAEQYKHLREFRGRERPSAAINVKGPAELVLVEVLEAIEMLLGPAELIGTKRAITLTEVQRTQLLRQVKFALELSSTKAVAEVNQVVGTQVVARVEGLKIVESRVETREIYICCKDVPCPPDKPLVLHKWADACTAQVGDVVTLYIKYSNHGGRPMTDVAVSDSLTGRLEYIPGSARSNRDAVFTTQANEAGSTILRWEVNGRLLPGESGVVSFQARVR